MDYIRWQSSTWPSQTATGCGDPTERHSSCLLRLPSANMKPARHATVRILPWLRSVPCTAPFCGGSRCAQIISTRAKTTHNTDEWRLSFFLSFLLGVAHAPFACHRWGLPHRLAQCATPGKGLWSVARHHQANLIVCVVCSCCATSSYREVCRAKGGIGSGKTLSGVSHSKTRAIAWCCHLANLTA